MGRKRWWTLIADWVIWGHFCWLASFSHDHSKPWLLLAQHIRAPPLPQPVATLVVSCSPNSPVLKISLQIPVTKTDFIHATCVSALCWNEDVSLYDAGFTCGVDLHLFLTFKSEKEKHLYVNNLPTLAPLPQYDCTNSGGSYIYISDMKYKLIYNETLYSTCSDTVGGGMHLFRWFAIPQWIEKRRRAQACLFYR